MDRDAVCVVLPAYDEAETVGEVVAGFRERGFADVLVIDGGSSDDTRERAEAAGARVVTQSGTGKGQAIREAVARHVDAPYVLMADADGTYRPEDADAMLEPLFSGRAEHVVGDRFADVRDGAMSRFNALGNRTFNWLFEHIHGGSYGDILSGYRAFTRASFERLRLTADGFGIETELSVECARQGVPTAVVPITYLPRPDGSNTNLHPLRDGGIILMAMYRQAKTSNPLFYFGSAGGLSWLVGLALAAYVAYEWVVAGVSHEVYAIAAGVALLFGVQLLVFGVLSDLIVTLHRETLERVEGLERRTRHQGRREPRPGVGSGADVESEGPGATGSSDDADDDVGSDQTDPARHDLEGEQPAQTGDE